MVSVMPMLGSPLTHAFAPAQSPRHAPRTARGGGRPRQRKLVENGPPRCKPTTADQQPNAHPGHADMSTEDGELSPLRRLYKRSRLRHFIRQRRNAAFYHLTRA